MKLIAFHLVGCLLLSAFTTHLAFAEDAQPAGLPPRAETIVKEFAAKRAEALEAFLGEHPEAPDRLLAISSIIQDRMDLQQWEKVRRIMADHYDHYSSKSDREERLNALLVIEDYVPICMRLGDRDAAKKFIAQVLKDFEGDPLHEELLEFVERLNALVDRPIVGDDLKLQFTATDGSEVDLAALHGKVVLIDFWASWCQPCIVAMPTLVKAYDEFKDQGLEIIGISLDEDRAAMDRAIERMGMPWPQFFDGKGWNNEIAEANGVTAIPHMILIGRDGKVVAIPEEESVLEEIKAALDSQAASSPEKVPSSDA